MAAVLKKRALAQYSQTQVEASPQTFKKLRLVKKSETGPSAILTVNKLEEDTVDNKQALQLLLDISENLEFDAFEIPDALKKLSSYFKSSSDAAIRVKILSLFAELGCEPGVDWNAIIEETVSLLKNETSHKVMAQGISTILKLAANAPENTSLHSLLVDIGKKYLTDVSIIVKCRCLELIGLLLPLHSKNDLNNTLKIAENYFHSEDARVRSEAFSTILCCHERGFNLNPSMYSDVCDALKDDYENVRKVALKLVWVLGNSYPENIIILPESEQEIRMIDDAFGKVCSAVNDLSKSVRTIACQLLGTMTLVSSKFLHQTLDKKLMSNMRKKRSAHELAWENLTSGEWASGKKWADDAPRELVDADSVNLMSSGACGAFVHGLEDEYLEVRTAAVEALCQLSMSDPLFANTSLDFLVDMFNDEIENVRLKAIDSLRNISRHIVLREDQLETILGALEDYSFDVREGLHRMLSSCKLSTTTCLQMCVDKLLDNLKKYPQDKRSTYRCFQKIGSFHPELTLPIVPQLLGIHPFFDTAEPDVDTPSYVCILILVLNAAQHCPTMLSMLEQHTLRHYSYLRDTMPNLVPPLKFTDTALSVKRFGCVTESKQFLETIINNLDNVSGSNRVKITLLETAQTHLNRLAEMDEAVAGAAQFTALFIGAQLLMTQILAHELWASPVTLASQQSQMLKNSIQQLLQHCLKLEYLFVGLNDREICTLKQFRLKALAIHLAFVVEGSNASALAPCHHFLSAVEETERLLSSRWLEPEAFTAAVFREMSLLDEPKPGSVSRALLPLLQATQLEKPPIPNTNIQMSKAVILEPSGETDTALKFTAGLIMAVPVEAEFTNLQDPSRLRLKIKYPDQSTQVMLPKTGDLKPLELDGEDKPDSGTNLRLLTTALISHQVWTEACFIDINIALSVPEGDVTRRKAHPDSSACLIDLCKPVRVCVAPKPVKKGVV